MQRRREILDACAQQYQIKRKIAPSGDGLGARETAAKRVVGNLKQLLELVKNVHRFNGRERFDVDGGKLFANFVRLQI